MRKWIITPTYVQCDQMVELKFNPIFLQKLPKMLPEQFLSEKGRF